MRSLVSGSSPPRRRGATSTTSAACRRWSTTRARSRCCAPRRWSGRHRGGGRCRRRASAGRTSAGSPRCCRSPWPGWARRRGPPLDLHRGTFDVDERAIEMGVRLMARTTLHAWRRTRGAPCTGNMPARRDCGPDAPSREAGTRRCIQPISSRLARPYPRGRRVPAEPAAPVVLEAGRGAHRRPAVTSGATWSPACSARPAGRSCPTRSRRRCGVPVATGVRVEPLYTPEDAGDLPAPRRGARGSPPLVRGARADAGTRCAPTPRCPRAGTSGSGTPTRTSQRPGRRSRRTWRTVSPRCGWCSARARCRSGSLGEVLADVLLDLAPLLLS